MLRLGRIDIAETISCFVPCKWLIISTIGCSAGLVVVEIEFGQQRIFAVEFGVRHDAACTLLHRTNLVARLVLYFELRHIDPAGIFTIIIVPTLQCIGDCAGRIALHFGIFTAYNRRGDRCAVCTPPVLIDRLHIALISLDVIIIVYPAILKLVLRTEIDRRTCAGRQFIVFEISIAGVSTPVIRHLGGRPQFVNHPIGERRLGYLFVFIPKTIVDIRRHIACNAVYIFVGHRKVGAARAQRRLRAKMAVWRSSTRIIHLELEIISDGEVGIVVVPTPIAPERTFGRHKGIFLALFQIDGVVHRMDALHVACVVVRPRSTFLVIKLVCARIDYLHQIGGVGGVTAAFDVRIGQRCSGIDRRSRNAIDCHAHNRIVHQRNRPIFSQHFRLQADAGAFQQHGLIFFHYRRVDRLVRMVG